MKIVFDITKKEDVLLLNHYSNKPDQNGIFEIFEVILPNFSKGVYFAPFQKYDPLPNQQYPKQWPSVSNRGQMLVFDDVSECVKEGGMYINLELVDGTYLTILPLTGKKTSAWFQAIEGKLYLKLGHLGTNELINENIPLLAWSHATNVYQTCENVWRLAIHHPLINYSTNLRTTKLYPEVFQYLGWCTWEEYKMDINEEIILKSLELIEDSDVPIRMVLIDDGHLHHKNRELVSFKTDQTKFPTGWSKIISRKNLGKLKYLGLWLNFNGYWSGISKDNQLGEINNHLRPLMSKNALAPKNNELSAIAFYNEMIKETQISGFDFLKIDDQGASFRNYVGTENPVESAAFSAQAMELAVNHYMHGLINCMAHGPVNFFNTRNSCITRNSEDYAKGQEDRGRRHLHNSYSNMSFMGQTVWGDHDMFHTSDEVFGEMMALSKAMSGAPVLVSDPIEQIRPDRVWPLCFKDGKIIRPLAPATVTRDTFFVNAYEGGKAYSVVAPLLNKAVAVVGYNYTYPAVRVKGSINLSHYVDGGVLLQDGKIEWDLPKEGVLAYDYKNKKAFRLKDKVEYELEAKLCDQFHLLFPIEHKRAVIGRIDKYLTANTYELLHQEQDYTIIKVFEVGNDFYVYSEKEIIEDTYTVEKIDQNLWNLKFENKGHEQVVKIKFGE